MTIEQAVRDHYRGKRLRRAKMEELLGYKASSSAGRRRFFGFAVAACVALVGGWMLRDLARELSPRVAADEVAKNHLKDQPVAVATNDWHAAGKSLERLDFDLAVMDGFALYGVRHCSLDGEIAAQLKVDRATMYQTRWRREHRVLDGVTVTTQGVRVRFWRHGDVLIALAE